MAIEADIGAILFRDILKIYQYPGAPFTGNIINDLILYFFVPMVFVIFFIYMLLGRLVAGVQWLRFLMGIAIFLFMIVNGWFAMFALMAGPYFVFLIIGLGALFFIPSHFRVSGGGGRPTGMPSEAVSRSDKLSYWETKRRLEFVQRRIKEIEGTLSRLSPDQRGEKAAEELQKQIHSLREEEHGLKEELRIIKY